MIPESASALMDDFVNGILRRADRLIISGLPPLGSESASYLRISEDREGEALGVSRQRDDSLGLAAADGAAIPAAAQFGDNDISASTRSRKPRPDFERLVAYIVLGQVRTVYAYSNSRLTRRPLELELLIRLHDRCGVRFRTVASGSDDLGTADGRMVARIKAAVDAAEAERLGERVARKQKATREAGGWTGGPRPFGYEPDGMTVREYEAAAIRDAYETLALGASLASIVRRWNGAGLRTGRSGQEWTTAGVRECLKNPRYAGRRGYLGEDIGPASWPAIVPEETWLATRGILTAHARAHGPVSSQRLLTGVALCGVCGGPVHASGGSAGNPVYRCATSNGHFVRKGAAIDAFVIEVIRQRLGRDDVADLLAGTDRGDAPATKIREQRTAVEARLEALATDFADDTLTPGQLRVATRRLRERLADLDGQLAAVGRVNVLTPIASAPDPAEAFMNLTNDGKRPVIGILADVVILPAGRGRKGFDPETVRIGWHK